jgi:hypothetical protein
MPLSLERLVRNQVLFREVNDRINDVADRFDVVDGTDFVCECSREDCTQTLRLELSEYEGVRSAPTLFVIAPGHETPEVEIIIEENDRFALVEKTHAVDIVIKSDPRSRDAVT